MIKLAIYKDKRRNTYYIDEKIKVSDGSFKHMVSRGYKSVREAQYDLPNKIDEFKAKWESRLGVKTGDNSLNSLVDEYLRHYKQKVRISTYQNNERIAKKFIKGYAGFENKTLDKIFSNRPLSEWREFILEMECSNAHKNKIFKFMSSLLDFATRMDILSGSCANLKINFDAIISDPPKSNLNFLSKDDYMKFLDTFEKDDKWYVLFTLLFTLGTRVSEFKALKWTDYNVDKKCITIEKQLTNKVQAKTYVIFDYVKSTNSYRTIYLPQQVNDLLMEYKKATCEDENNFIFFGKRPTCDSTIRRKLNKHVKLAKLSHLTIHGVRHSTATYLISQTNNMSDLKIIADMLGHDMTTLLKTYVHSIPSQQEKFINNINIFQ